jgi:hypothetical protein
LYLDQPPGRSGKSLGQGTDSLPGTGPEATGQDDDGDQRKAEQVVFSHFHFSSNLMFQVQVEPGDDQLLFVTYVPGKKVPADLGLLRRNNRLSPPATISPMATISPQIDTQAPSLNWGEEYQKSTRWLPAGTATARKEP